MTLRPRNTSELASGRGATVLKTNAARGPTAHTERRPSRLVVLCALLVCPVFLGATCVGKVAGPNLRWKLFSAFGTQRLCPEMLKRGVPLRLSAGGNTVGRFFPKQCSHQVNDPARSVTLHFSGTGYAWTPVAGRVGFSASASVEYAMDWRPGGGRTTYVWGRWVRAVRGPEFSLGAVENKAVNWAAKGTPVAYLANTFGEQIITSQMVQGFTVIHHPRRGDEFALGHFFPPQRPPTPFDTEQGKRLALANETTEVHTSQVDFLGPFEVTKDNQALFLRFNHLGGPGVEALLFQQGALDVWREGLQLGQPLTTPAVAPILSFPIPARSAERQKLPLPPGLYTLVLDNSDKLGTVRPPWNPLDALGKNPAVVAYLAELGNARDPQ